MLFFVFCFSECIWAILIQALAVGAAGRDAVFGNKHQPTPAVCVCVCVCADWPPLHPVRGLVSFSQMLFGGAGYGRALRPTVEIHHTVIVHLNRKISLHRLTIVSALA